MRQHVCVKPINTEIFKQTFNSKDIVLLCLHQLALHFLKLIYDFIHTELIKHVFNKNIKELHIQCLLKDVLQLLSCFPEIRTLK